MKAMSMVAAVAMASGVAMGQLSLTRIATVDFTDQITNGPISAVAWNGSDLFVGTYASTAGNVAITRRDNALGAGSFSTFGAIAANQFRGFTGLAIRGNLLAASVDTTGAAATGNVRLFDTSGNLLFNSPSDATSNGQSGVAFDPVNGGVAFPSFGAGRFRQYDASTGAAIWTNGAGPFNFDALWGTAYRDIAFDGAGNVYAREGAQVIRFTRIGPNQFQVPFSSSMILNPLNIPEGPAEDNVVGQNLAVTDDFGGVIFYNNRAPGSGGSQNMADILKAMDLNGNALSITFTNPPSFFLNNALVDMSYDAATDTLAVSEFSSNRVYIYRVIPTPGAMAVLGLAGLVAARRRRS